MCVNYTHLKGQVILWADVLGHRRSVIICQEWDVALLAHLPVQLP